MKTDLSEQIHDLMERGLRPVTMADIESRSPVRVTRVRRAAAQAWLGHGRLILAGAAAIAACAALAVAALLTSNGTGATTGQSHLAAWTVAKQPGGSVMVTLHQVR